MSLVAIFVSLFAILFTVVMADDSCRFETRKGVIDLTSVGRSDGTAAYSDVIPSSGSGYKYSYNPCRPFSEGNACQNVAACQVSADGAFTFTLGTQNTALWNPGAILGSIPSVTYQFAQKYVIVQLKCGNEGDNRFDALGEGPTNTYKFILTHRCACWDGCTSPPPPPPPQNCSIDGTVYTSDKQVIQSLPFEITINPLQPQPSPPTSSYATVDIYGSVIELTLINIVSPPSAIYCLSQLQALSFLNGTNLTISSEVLRLSSSLKSLIVTNSAIPLVLPVELYSLTTLKVLSLVNCGLERLSEVINKLTQLNQLTLDQNQLTTLPVTLGQMSSLTFLSVSNNPRLSSLDSLSGSTSLVILLGSNCTINEFHWNIPNLLTIDLSGNQLTSLEGMNTVKSLSRDRFSFGNNKISSLPNATLENTSTLRYFDLSNNALTTLPYWIYSQDWQTFNIRFNKFSVKEAEWIRGIFRMTNITAIM